MSAYKEAVSTVLRQWYNTFRWVAIVGPPLVAFSDNIGTVQVVAGQSMSPTLNPDPTSIWLDVVLVSRVSNFSRGDIVLLPEPIKEKRTRIVKRVADITRDGCSVYLLGDNSLHSTDSRQFGHVPGCLVEGVVKGIVFPPWRIRSL